MGDADEITIVLADDHAVVRSGLRLLLDQAGLHVLAEAGDAESALRSVLGHKPTVLVLDLNMPGTPTWLEAIPRVTDVSPRTRVVVLTMQEDPVFAREALRPARTATSRGGGRQRVGGARCAGQPSARPTSTRGSGPHWPRRRRPRMGRRTT